MPITPQGRGGDECGSRSTLSPGRPTTPTLSRSHGPKGNLIYKLITTTDHKLIGIMYCVACFIFFMIGGLMALLIRTELAAPGGLQFLSNEQFNQLFTMHGTAMLLFYATPDRVRLRQSCSAAADRRPPDVAFPPG